MSGIYIPGMEMPEHCGYCRFRYDGICHALQKTQYSMEECPLVPVPYHGRLIDADELIHDKGIDTYSAVFAVANAPTIILASGGKENE